MKAALALVALAVVFYWPAVNAGYIWDDGVVYANPLVAEPGGLPRIWLAPTENPHEPHYWPVVYTTFWLEYRLWDNDPRGYHVDNILLHAFCVWLLWHVLRRLDVRHAWLGAALFAVHPVHVESVAWIAERKDVLSAALSLGAALVYLKSDGRRRARDMLSLVLFALAMLSKSIVVTLPAALALVHWWKDGRLTAGHLRRLAPFVMVGVALTAFDLWLFYGRSESAHLTTPLLERIQLAGRVLAFYPQKLLWPHPLVSLYPKWRLDASSIAGWLPLAGVLAVLAVMAWQHRRLGRGPVAAVQYYALTLAPALGLVIHGFMAYAWVADRFQYLPSIGPLALIGAGLGGLVAAHPRARVLPGALILILGGLTWRQSALYRDHVTLFRHNVGHYPHAWQARAQLSGGLAREGRHEEAVEELKKVLREDVDERHTLHLELGAMQLNLGQLKEGEENIAAALRLVPDYAEAHYELGRLRARQGRRREALSLYRRALELRPDFPQAEDGLRGLLDSLPPAGAH